MRFIGSDFIEQGIETLDRPIIIIFIGLAHDLHNLTSALIIVSAIFYRRDRRGSRRTRRKTEASACLRVLCGEKFFTCLKQ
jgi:hypothetical protein